MRGGSLELSFAVGFGFVENWKNLPVCVAGPVFVANLIEQLAEMVIRGDQASRLEPLVNLLVMQQILVVLQQGLAQFRVTHKLWVRNDSYQDAVERLQR